MGQKVSEQRITSWLKLAQIPRLDYRLVENFLRHYNGKALENVGTEKLSELGFNPVQIKAWQSLDPAVVERCLD